MQINGEGIVEREYVLPYLSPSVVIIPFLARTLRWCLAVL